MRDTFANQFESMRISIFLIAVCSAIFLSACSDDEVKPQEFALEQPDVFAEADYQVYSAILEHYDLGFYPLLQQTSNYRVAEENFALFFNLSELQNMEENLYQKFLDVNVDQKLLDDKVAAEEQVIKLIPNQEFNFYFSEDDEHRAWEAFSKSYPTSNYSLFMFSQVGMNESHTQAITAIHYYYGESVDWRYQTDEFGALVYLEKSDSGNWEVIKSATFQK